MRYIKTTNNYVEFIEADDSQNILSVRGFQFGELYFQIKNKKVTFYLNDQENPWRNDVWTINIPFELDGELYEDEDSAAEALEAIINDSFQEQLDELKEGLADEVTRSTAKDVEHDTLISALTEDLEALAEDLEDEIERSTAEDARLDQKIDDEIADRISGDTYLEGLINAETSRAEGAESAITAALNAEISRSTAKDNEHDALISGLTSDLADEIARSMAKDAEHDAEISGLTADLNNEITRAMSAETNLHDEILAERNRALAAESALTNALGDEVSRSTAKDNEHDALISGLTANLNSEIVRAMSAETVLHNEILAETTRALAAEDALVTALNNEVSRSTAKDASHDAEISGLTTSLQSEINRAVGAENSLRDDLNDEISARTSSDNSQNQRLTALEVGKADKSDVYTKAESDNKYATKEYVSGNTYTKAEIATMMADKADKLNAVSTALYNSQNKTIDFKNIYGNVIASVDARDFIKDGMVQDAIIRDNNLVITFNTDAGKEDIVVPLTDIFDPSNYYTKTETDEAIADAIDDIDLSNYYTKSEVDASQLVQDNKINAISGDVQTLDGKVDTISANTYTKSEVDDIVNDIESGITQDLSNYYTKSEVDASQTAQDNKINAISGKVDTISGDVITLGSNVQSLSGEVETISGDVQTISGKVDDMKTYVGGRGITITSGKTADTISFNLPIWSGEVSSSIIEGYSNNEAKVQYSHAEGYSTLANNRGTHAEGWITKANGDFGSHSEGYDTNASGESSHAEGHSTVAAGDYSHAEGYNTSSYNEAEHACGYYNISRNTAATFKFGYSGDTLFSVGNGNYNRETSATTKHNAFEIRQNGDIYISDTNASGEYYQKPMIKLQDALGQGGGGGVTPTEVQTMIDNSISGKADSNSVYTKSESDAKYATIADFNSHSGNTNLHVTAAEKATWNAKSDFSGNYNDLTNKPTIPNYTAGDGIDITNNVISTVTKFACVSESEWASISGNPQSNTVYMIY